VELSLIWIVTTTEAVSALNKLTLLTLRCVLAAGAARMSVVVTPFELEGVMPGVVAEADHVARAVQAVKHGLYR
jgi:hypothetical protein